MSNLFRKLILFLIFGPVILAVLAQWILAMAAAFLPFLLLAAAIAGGVAGLTAGLVLRHRLVPRERARRFARYPPRYPLE